MTREELIDQLGALRPERAMDRTELGRELATAALDGRTAPWVRAGFALIERALGDADPQTRDLGSVVLVETLRGVADRHASSEALAGVLGPASRALIAERVILDGPRDRFAFTSQALQFVASASEVEWQRGDRKGRWRPSGDDVARILRPLQPLVAMRPSERTTFGDMHAMIDVDGPRGPAIIMIGREVDGGRIARHLERWFVIDHDAVVVQWSWLSERVQ